MLDDAGVGESFARARRLPRGYGVGLDERAVEYPWLQAKLARAGRVLDAGSTLNHAHILDRFLPGLDALHVVTLVPEPIAFPERGVSYVYADLRDLPFRDGWYDTVVSISTLEHVGMDNSMYGAGAERAADPDVELGRAVDELRRVLRPGGRLLVSVPYGRREDHGWFRQFGREDIGVLLDALRVREGDAIVYRYDRRGWQRSSLRDAADAAYRDYTADQTPVSDLAAAARAVVCVVADR